MTSTQHASTSRNDVHYRLAATDIGQPREIELSPAEAERTVGAMRTCTVTLELEEKLQIFLDNLIELEQFILKRAAESAIWTHVTWELYRKDATTIVRHLTNLLNSGRLLQSHTPRGLTAIGQDNDARSYKEARNTNRNQSVAYGCVECVRNGLQHERLLADSIHYPRKLDLSESNDRPTNQIFGISPRLEPNSLRSLTGRHLPKDAAFTRALKQWVEPQQLMPLVREYVEILAIAHEKETRSSMEKATGEADRVVEGAIARAKSQFDKAGCLCVIRRTDGDPLDETEILTEVVDEPIKRRRQLQTTNRGFMGFARRWVRGDEATTSPAPTSNVG